MSDLRTAIGLLTVLPVRCGDKVSARAFAYFPLIGLLIGLALSGAALLLRIMLPNLVIAALLVALWAVLTGGLHLDGFSDACDGLFAATTPEHRLEILHDVHLGAFGAAGLVLLLITKVAVVASLVHWEPLLLAPVLGRWAVVFAAAYPPARSDGLAVTFRTGLTRRHLLAATILAVLPSAAMGWFGCIAFTAAALVAALIARLACSRLGGLTGDIYGMICESVEVGVLVIGSAL